MKQAEIYLNWVYENAPVVNNDGEFEIAEMRFHDAMKRENSRAVSMFFYKNLPEGCSVDQLDPESRSYDPSDIVRFPDGSEVVVSNPNAAAFETFFSVQ